MLEVGSLNINGTVRDFFTDCSFTGIDIGEGKDVDEVCSGEDFPGPANHFDVIVSTEVFEHTPSWDLIVLNMIRLLKKDGLLMFSCAAPGRPQHGTKTFYPGAAPYISGTSDYYLNLDEKDFQGVVNFDYWFSAHFFLKDHDSLYFVGTGKNASTTPERIRILKKNYDDYVFKRLRLGLPHEYIMDNYL